MIEESRTYQDITTVSYTDWTDVKTDATGNPLGDENDITNTTLYRFRLSYDDLNLTKDAAGNVVQPPTNDFELSINGTPTTVTAYSDAEAAYQAVKDNPGQIAYIASTGEIVFSEEAYQNPKDVLGINIDSIEDIKIDVKYAKSNWQAGDLNPVHYFHCVATDQANQTQAMDLKSKQDDLMQSLSSALYSTTTFMILSTSACAASRTACASSICCCASATSALASSTACCAAAICAGSPLALASLKSLLASSSAFCAASSFGSYSFLTAE